jgi:phosphoribosylanthranilate isomerase
MAAPTVKICGLQTPETAAVVAGLPVDQAGFVFAMSKRQVTPEKAGELIAVLRDSAAQPTGTRPLTVGVFVNPSMEELERTLAAAPLDVVQLHGAEDPDFCREVKSRFGVQIYKVVSLKVASDEGPDSLQMETFSGAVDAVLLDTLDPVYGGGSGKTFDWERIPAHLSEARRLGLKLIVAGGLTPDNVADLIETYRPDGVDVSSGVETEGVKDADKIKSFVERVKSL